MSYTEILIVFWMALAAWAYFEMWMERKRRRKAERNTASALRSFWGGYFAALMNEGYSKGDATKKTLLQIRRVRDRDND